MKKNLFKPGWCVHFSLGKLRVLKYWLKQIDTLSIHHSKKCFMENTTLEVLSKKLACFKMLSLSMLRQHISCWIPQKKVMFAVLI